MSDLARRISNRMFGGFGDCGTEAVIDDELQKYYIETQAPITMGEPYEQKIEVPVRT